MNRIVFPLPILLSALFILLLGGLVLPSTLAQGEEPEWIWMNPLPQGNNLNGVWGSVPMMFSPSAI